jgi:hypothetical protein
VKRVFLILQFCDQLFSPINRDLIAYLALDPAIPLNRFVDLNALLTHEKFRIAGLL